MSYRTRVSTIAVLVGVLTLGLATATRAAPARGRGAPDPFAIASEHLDSRTLAFDTDASYNWATLTVSGPQGIKLRQKFTKGEPLTQTLVTDKGETLPDGSYRYMLRLMPRGEGGNTQTGLFFIEDGQAVSRSSKRSELGQIRERLNQARRERQQAQTRAKPDPETKIQTPPATRSEGIQPLSPEVAPKPTADAVADTLVIYGAAPELYFYESEIIPYWSSISQNNGYQTRTSYFGLSDSAIIIWESSYFSYSGASYFRGTWGDYHVQGGYDHFVYGYGYSYGTYYTPGLLALQHRFYDVDTSVYETLGLYVTRSGVGLRTQNPGADLEIYDPGSFAAFRLNNGLASWAVTNTDTGVISFNKIGSGGQEFTVRPRLDAAGPTMEVQGTVRATNFSVISSRQQKTDFKSLDGEEILAQLAQLPIQSWRYKHEPEGVRHFGAVAEDFHDLFQIGDEGHLSTVDVTGVMMAAIQQLRKENAELRTAQAELRRRLAALEDPGR